LTEASHVYLMCASCLQHPSTEIGTWVHETIGRLPL
jgi:hypothetical protein